MPNASSGFNTHSLSEDRFAGNPAVDSSAIVADLKSLAMNRLH